MHHEVYICKITMRKFFLIALVSLPLLAASSLHKYYVSITQIEYNKDHKSLEVISRIFYDDFEHVLKERYDSNIEVDGNTYPKEKLNAYIKKYFEQRFHIQVNGAEKPLDYIGYENEDDYMVFYLEAKGINTLKSIEVDDPMLMEVFPEQKNVVHIKAGNTHKSFMLYSENDKALLKFSQKTQ